VTAPGAPVSLRSVLKSDRTIFGVLVKTTHHQVVEVLAASGVDFVMLDQEHAPFDAHILDCCLMACRGAGIAGIVRVPELSERAILSVLDLGAAGVIVPHVRTREEAELAGAFARYRGGRRGYSNSTRAGRHATMPMQQHVDEADASVAVILMIEDRVGVENAQAIAAVRGIDMLMVGHADLALSLGHDRIDVPAVAAAEARVMDAARRAGMPIGTLAAVPEDVTRLRAAGARMFILGIDQTILSTAVAGMLTRARAAP
jgi:2-keto-3-deoxy-L-rhamnonate aldolase RhmA